MKNFSIQTASADEAWLVKMILDKASTVPAGKNIEQWPESFNIEKIIENIQTQCVYLFYDSNSQPIGTVDCRYDDNEIWNNQAHNAIYMHRLAIDPALSGKGWGKKIIGWVIEKAKTEGKNFVRLDCITNNSDLRAYYETIGFIHVRDIEWSGGRTSLYELFITP